MPGFVSPRTLSLFIPVRRVTQGHPPLLLPAKNQAGGQAVAHRTTSRPAPVKNPAFNRTIDQLLTIFIQLK